MARIRVIVLNYRTAEMTRQAAEAALRAMEGLDAELIVVDNDSGDGSEASLRAGLPDATVIQSGHNGGFGAGNNVGITHAGDPDYVYVLNSDAFPESDALRHLVDFLDKTPKAGLAGSRILGEDGAPHMTAFRFPSIWSELESAARFGPVSRLLRRKRVPRPIPDATVQTDWVAGASVLIRTQMLRDIGLFDEQFFLYFEETDLCLRAHRAGWSTYYVVESVVTHIGSVSTGMKRWTRIPGFWLDSRWYYFARNHGRATAALATGMHLLGGLIWRARRVLQRRPAMDPPHFLRDLVTHDLKALFAPLPKPRIAFPPKEETPS